MERGTFEGVRVAALYDIHGNLPSLEAVLEEVRQARVDRIVVGGDVLPGPMPRETLSCLLGLEIPVQFILGNGEVAVLEQMAGRAPSAVPEPYRPIIRWNAEELPAEYERITGAWPKTLSVEVSGLGHVLFCHATPQSEDEIFTCLTPAEQLLPVFGGAPGLVICGHTHMQFDRTIGETRLVNAGSVGMPFGERGAYWLLLGPGIELRRTTYDFAKAADRIRATSYPQAEDFAANNVLKPPSERRMLELFTVARK
jgi:predicted phosphodiesterase